MDANANANADRTGAADDALARGGSPGDSGYSDEGRAPASAMRARKPSRSGYGYASADEVESKALETTSVEGVFDATSLPPPPTVAAAWAPRAA